MGRGKFSLRMGIAGEVQKAYDKQRRWTFLISERPGHTQGGKSLLYSTAPAQHESVETFGSIEKDQARVVPQCVCQEGAAAAAEWGVGGVWGSLRCQALPSPAERPRLREKSNARDGAARALAPLPPLHSARPLTQPLPS